jgi:hypothetical protein
MSLVSSIVTDYEQLSVYSTYYFPLSFQFEEDHLANGMTRYHYDRRIMPEWKDLTNTMKLDMFLLNCEEKFGSLYTFNPHIHPELLIELEGKDLVTELGKRMARYLGVLGEEPKHYAFVVEGHGKDGKPTRPHVHGMAMVRDEKQADAVRLAVGKAAGQDIKGRGKLPSGNQGRFYAFVEGKSWSGYMSKNIAKDIPNVNRRPIVISRVATQVCRSFYNYVVGRDLLPPNLP